MITIRSVAKQAGVAVSTASLALNNKPNVSGKTRQKVLKAAEKLDYHPYSVARNLANRQTKNLSLINPIPIDTLFTGGYFSQLIKGIYKVAAAHGYNLSLHIADGEREAAEQIDLIMQTRSADGLLITQPTVNAPYIDTLAERSFPCVFIGRPPKDRISYVNHDNIKVSYMAVKHLISLGHRKIAFITSSPKLTFCIDRLNGYRSALKEAGIEYDESLVWESEPTEEEAHHIVSEALKREEFSAIFTTNDLQAVGAIKALQERGFMIPDDIALVSVNNTDLASHFEPAITTVDLHIYDLGYWSVKLLIDQISGEQPDRIIVSSELVIRRSCGYEKKGVMDGNRRTASRFRINNQ